MSGHIEDVLTRRVHPWWPPIRKALEAGLARHSENSLLAAKTTIPAEVRRQLKALKDAGKIPGMKRVEIDSPSRFYLAYKQLLEHGGRPDAIWEEQTPIKELLAEEDGATRAMGKAILAAVVDDKPELSAAVRFGSRDGILTEAEARRLVEMKPPLGWINRTLLQVTQSEHERLKREQPKLLERVEVIKTTEVIEGVEAIKEAEEIRPVEVIEIPDEVECKRLELERKLNEARVTELVFHPNFDTGKMDASYEGFGALNDLLRKECSRSRRGLWHANSFGSQASGRAIEVEAIRRADAIIRHGAEPVKTAQALFSLRELSKRPQALKKAEDVISSMKQIQADLPESAKAIYQDASPEAVRVLDACLWFAVREQRPPTRGELRVAVNWQNQNDPFRKNHGSIKEFTNLLREVGLAWLKEDDAARGKRNQS